MENLEAHGRSRKIVKFTEDREIVKFTWKIVKFMKGGEIHGKIEAHGKS